MRDAKSLNEQLWEWTDNINTGANLIIPVSSIAGGVAQADCQYRPLLRFGLYADQPLTLTVEVAMVTGGVFTVDQTLVTIANAWHHVYDLPAPQNATGFFVLNANWVRIRLANASGTNTTVLQFQAGLRNRM